jgi:hypothetical protein
MSTSKNRWIPRERIADRLRKNGCPRGTVARLVKESEGIHVRMDDSLLSRWLLKRVEISPTQRERIELAVSFVEHLQASSPLPVNFSNIQRLLPLWKNFQREAQEKEPAPASEVVVATAAN